MPPAAGNGAVLREERGGEVGVPDPHLDGDLPLDDLSPRTPRLPPIIIRPFVGVVGRHVEIRANREVAEAFWVPLAAIRERASWGLGTVIVHEVRRTVSDIALDILRIAAGVTCLFVAFAWAGIRTALRAPDTFGGLLAFRQSAPEHVDEIDRRDHQRAQYASHQSAIAGYLRSPG